MRPLLLALTLALALAALVPSAASAAITRPYQSSFGSFVAEGEVANPPALAVDQSNGDVYAVRTKRLQSQIAAVERFDSSGSPKNFTAGPYAGTNALSGLARRNSQRLSVAIDNSGGPLDGDIYVLSEEPVPPPSIFRYEVKVFAPSGEPLGSLSGSGTIAGEFDTTNRPCDVTVDQSNGDLFIAKQGAIYRYSPKSPSGEINDADYTVTGIGGVQADCGGLGISSGSVYAGNSNSGALRKYPLASFSAAVPQLAEVEPIPGIGGVTGLGVDPKTGEIYVDRGNRVTVLDPATDSPTYSFGFHAYFDESKAVAVKSAPSGPASAVYVADPVSHEVDVFGAPSNVPVFTHPEVASFGSDGSAASSFSELDQLGFDQAGQKLYALDDKTPGIYGFDASAPPVFPGLSGFTPLGTAPVGNSTQSSAKPGLAVDNSGLGSAGNLYLTSAETNLLYGFNPSAAPLGGFPVDSEVSPGAPNGSPKNLCGTAVDSAGHVWVANSASNQFLEYSSSGAFIGATPSIVTPEVQQLVIRATSGQFKLSFGGGTSPNLPFNATAAAVQAALEALPGIGAGNVAVSGGPGDATGSSPYVISFQGTLATTDVPPIGAADGSTPLEGGLVAEGTTPVEPGRGAALDTTTPAAPASPCRLAFDSNDNLYVVIGSDGKKVWRYSAASSYASATQVDPALFPQSIAVDPSNNHLYVAHLSWVDEYDSVGSFVEEFATDLTNITGITVDENNGNVYVAADNKIHVLGPRVLRPDLAIDPASAVTNTSATLSGTIGAQGLAVSDCHFEYVREAAFGASGFSDLSSGGSVPCSPAAGSIPVDTELHSVSASITGLSRNVAYRFRLVATNTNGPSATEALGFETVGPPLVETTGSPVRTMTTARLDSRVDPRGAAATYYFEYGDQGPCDTNPCTSTEPHPAGSGDEFELVSQQLEGLQPGVTYHYRVLADNGNPDGPVAGEDMTLTTFASEPVLSHGHLPGPPGSDRAWELASAPDTSGNPVGGFANEKFSISDNGDRAVYGVFGGTPDSETGTTNTMLFAERTPSGWKTKAILPSRDEANESEWTVPYGPRDLSVMISRNRPFSTNGKFTFWRLTPNSPAQRLEGHSESPQEAGLVGVSENSEPTVVANLEGTWDPNYPLPSNAGNIYDISSGQPRLIGLLPDGSVPPCGAGAVGAARTRLSHAVSADGSLVFFQIQSGLCSAAPAQLYMRNIDAETTTRISTPPVSGPECAANFIKSTPDAAFFYTQNRLVAKDAEPAKCVDPNSGQKSSADIYRYDLDDGSLDCVTCVVPGVQAGVLGSSNDTVGISKDGSRVYFASANRLLPGAAPKEGIYRVDVASGDLAYVAFTGARIGSVAYSNLSSDGSVAVFEASSPSLNALGGQQNAGTRQYYRYDDRDRSLICVSCPADGSAPRGLVPQVGPSGDGPGANVGALSADGEDFAFTTPTALLGADQNTAGAGQEAEAGGDIYEWRGGRLLLVSDGLINRPAGRSPHVIGITPSGQDIFFLEAAQLTHDALDGYTRLYDARIGGGFEFPPPPKPCPLEVCQGIPKGAPEEQAPGSATIAGVGNATTVQKKSKAKKKHQKKHHKKAKKTHHKANANRGAGR